ncbi:MULTISPECIES: Ldh family oxidoreductase [Micromonospora]|uniref:Malate/lactate/ureidoglycolate dehydrogenase, LDH2 family n=1 Tax=Micromonospora yangpuensis TaxID=683228 RepID=A0A1C6UV10_9ACTN|nr:Ldh family oxidoreductase [Micromonospora yangpuensis]GGM23763.1 lactate dehydrogenase [Micromonospora yangpuensis]SCL57831.1 Malate/lactate/ureidoglycolate dehydrogenase, LDH2 family [Micromonospora yangpuensis]
MRADPAAPTGRVRVDSDWLTTLVGGLLAATGLPRPAAATVAESLVDADRRGVPSHGVMLVPMYLDRLRSGSVSTATRAEPVVDLGAIAVLDAGHALGVLTADQAMALAVGKAREFGIGAVSVRRAFHFGAAGRYARAAAQAGLIGVAMSNTRPLMPAPGGGHPVVGNNPVALGLPAGVDGEPVVLDIALSEVALGRIRLAESAGGQIPTGWATDSLGRDTTDPAAALAGMLLPAAGHKGFGLALMVDALTGVLSGGGFGQQVRGLYADTAVPNDCAHFFLALDPAAFGDPAEFTARLAALGRQVTAPPYAPGVDRVTLPGERSARRLRESAYRGTPLDRALLDRLHQLAGELGLPDQPPSTVAPAPEGVH